MSKFGPGNPLPLTKAAIRFMRQCDVYVNKLSLFDRYLIWRYTIGSASVNSKLIMGKLSDNAIYWTFLFCKYWHNTTARPSVGIPKDFTFAIPLFESPASYNALDKGNQQAIAARLIDAYSQRLQQLIVKGPTTSESITVYKVAGEYPGLPKSGDTLPARVVQLPFNSTTVANDFNFYIFTQPESTCCFFKIVIPPGIHVLHVPTEYHAYPFEFEILLPIGITFNILDIQQGVLNYIEPKDINMELTQKKDDLVMGPVFAYNQYQPCKGTCMIRSKSFRVYDTVLSK